MMLKSKSTGECQWCIADNVAELLEGADGIVPGGFGQRGTEGKIQAIKYARERTNAGSLPWYAVDPVEFARMFGTEGANLSRIDPDNWGIQWRYHVDQIDG